MKRGAVSRRESDYWLRLRRDKVSGTAALSAILAVIFATLAWIQVLVPGSQFQARANPLYWALMLPTVYWAVSLTRYEPWAVVCMRLTFLAAPLMAAGALVFGMERNVGDSDIQFALLGLSIVASLLAGFLYRNSLLRREGPFAG